MSKYPIKFILESQNSYMSPAETDAASLRLVQRPLAQLGKAGTSTGSCRTRSGISHRTTLCHKH